MVEKASEYRVKSGDIFFFDNNIWMFLYSSVAGYAKSKQNAYGRLLEDIQRMKCPILINSLILSEFTNASLRSEYNIWRMKAENAFSNDYKRNFIPSLAYKQILADIKVSINQILKIATKGNDDFNAINIDTVIKQMVHCDFNDAYYLEYGRIKKYKIVTDDGDLYKHNTVGIDIITYKP